MKTILLLLLVGMPCYSQVGINTTNPTETLDVNGSLRLRTTDPVLNTSLASDNMLAIENEVVRIIPSKEIIANALPSAVKGTFITSGTISISLLTGSGIIPFDNEKFDTDNEFDTTSFTYVAKNSGIYEVSLHIALEATISAASNLGINIVKNGTVVHSNTFANVNVIGISVTPPSRQMHTVLSLSLGDTLHFELQGDIALGTVNLVGASQRNFFSIMQVR